MRFPSWNAAVLVMSSLVLFAAAGCGSGGDTATGRLRVVASTDVYGDLVATIGGGDVDVTSLIGDPSVDPHSFQAGVRTQLAVSRADLVVQNGGGYDDFMGTLVSATGSAAPVIDAVAVSGKAHGKAGQDGGGLNEHVWYDFPTMQAVVARIVAVLSQLDPANAGTYAVNGAQLGAGIQGLIAGEQAARAGIQGAGVVVTEPVPGYLLDALGARDETPAEFSQAIEEGGDVSPAVLRHTLGLVRGGRVRALIYNAQSSGPQTDRVIRAARASGVAVVPVTETLPPGQHYLSWMRDNLDRVLAALSA